MKNIVLNKASHLLAKIDNLISNQIAIIFQQSLLKELMQKWVELHLICQNPQQHLSIIKFLNINISEVSLDVGSSLDIINSQLFKKICELEFETSGGQPLGLIALTDYIDLRKTSAVSLINHLSQICALGFVPLVFDITPEALLESDLFSNLNIDSQVSQPSLASWERFRKFEHARFAYACLPNAVLTMENNFLTQKNKFFQLPFRSSILLTIRILQSFNSTGWFNELEGFVNFSEFATHNLKSSQIITISLEPEWHISEKNRIKLIHKGIQTITDYNFELFLFERICSVYTSSTVERIGIEHILCVSRFGHYIKGLAREKIGGFMDIEKCEKWLKNWLNSYTLINPPDNQINRFPLKHHNIKITPLPGQLGHYHCQISLEPHMKLENIGSLISINTDIIVSST